MEFTLANVISNLLVLELKSLITDIEGFFSNIHFVLIKFPMFFSTKWNSLLMKMQIYNTDFEPLHRVSCSKSTSGDEQRIQTAELNLMMSRLGMVGWLDDDTGNNSSLSHEEHLLTIFEEEEPSFEEIKETFGVFDVNKDGFIDANELQIVLSNLLGLKEVCSLEECKRMIKSCDGNGDGLIDFHEFVKFMEKCLS